MRCFRDENLRADRQFDFTQLDLEMSFVTEEDVFHLMEPLFAQLVLETNGDEVKTPFQRLTYRDAMDRYGSDKPDLRYGMELIPEKTWAFCWIVEPPLFEWSEEDEAWTFTHHPFTAPVSDDLSPETGLARGYDITLNGWELGSGSIRIHRPDVQRRIFDVLRIGEQEREERFGFLLRAFRYGVPPHGGIAPGLDRVVALLAGKDNIREVIAFPKTQSGHDPLTGAPGEVPESQLRELGLRLLSPERPT